MGSTKGARGFRRPAAWVAAVAWAIPRVHLFRDGGLGEHPDQLQRCAGQVDELELDARRDQQGARPVEALRAAVDQQLAAAQENKRDLEENSLLSNRLTHEYEELFTFIRAAWLFGDAPTLRALDAQVQRCGNALEWPAAADDRRASRGFVALLDGRLTEARELLRPLAGTIERSCFYPSSQAAVMLADVEQRLGLPDAAAATLAPWLASVRTGGGVAGGLLAGAPVLRRLAAAGWLDPDERELLERLARGLRASPAQRPSLAAPPHPAAPPRGDVLAVLSEREREVLGRMAAGDSNKIIARAFDLSPHTVKRHVANILDKLGVATRGQAAARWRELS